MTPALRNALVAADALLRSGAAGDARDALRRFSESDPLAADTPEFQLFYAESCFQHGDAEQAREHASRAIAGRPQWFEAQHLLGRALADLELLDEAAIHLQHATTLKPQHPRAAANLGSVYRRSGRHDEAHGCFRRAIAIDSHNAVAWRGLAETLQAVGDDDAAIDAWQRWMTLVPDRAEGLAGMGFAYTRMRRWDQAEQLLSQAVAMPDADHHADVLLGFVRRERGDVQGALDAYRRGAARSRGALTPTVAAELLLPPTYSSTTDVLDWRRRFDSGLANLASLWPRFDTAPQAIWGLDWTNFYLAYQGGDDRELQSRYADLVASLTNRAAPDWTASPPVTDPARRKIRVGFASSYLRRCTVGAYFQSWMTGLDRDRFEVYAFHFGAEVDDITETIRSAVDRFDHVAQGPQRIAQRIRAAHLDVLVYPEVGMDGRDVTLSTLRLAPVQCAAWGHPVTTGSSAIDYFISCEAMEPTDARAHYREQLLLLPGLGTSYHKPEVRAATRGEFGLRDDRQLYACPQSLFKIHPDNDAVFVALLEADPQGQLVFCAEPGQPVTIDFQARIERALTQAAIDPTRISWQPMRRERDFRALLSVCDVMVDTLHWSGGNTSLDALAAGLPIVTVPGRFLRGRQSAAMLQILGLPELVAEDIDSLVATAVRVATRRDAISAHITRNLAQLFERNEPIRALEDRLERIAVHPAKPRRDHDTCSGLP